MVKCEYCGKEMLQDEGCTFDHICINSEWYLRIKVGAPRDMGNGFLTKGERCGDCGALFGHYHHPGCDMETCPRCGEQLISCNCDPPTELMRDVA